MYEIGFLTLWIRYELEFSYETNFHAQFSHVHMATDFCSPYQLNNACQIKLMPIPNLLALCTDYQFYATKIFSTEFVFTHFV